jgi:hypothetical protein
MESITNWVSNLKTKIVDLEEDLTEDAVFEFQLKLFIELFTNDVFSETLSLLSSAKLVKDVAKDEEKNFEVFEITQS